MPVYGLSTEGLLVKTLSVIRFELGDALRAAFGPSIRTDDESILGQLIAILAERMASLWELAEVIHSSQDPDAATGSALEQICLLTGTLRPAASYSTVNLILTGTPTTAVASTSRVAAGSTGVEFETEESGVITAVPAWAATTAYVVGDRVTAGVYVHQCTTAGTSGAVSPNFNPDGTVYWVRLGLGTGAIDVLAAATETGPVHAGAYDLTEITTPVSGWDAAINLTDANLGRDIATDAELRLLRELQLALGGSSTVNALRAELLDVADVIAATIFVNNTDVTDVNGLPPHSIEALVRGPGTPSAAFHQSIWNALLAGVAAGIKTYGAIVGTAADDEGTAHTMAYTAPDEKPVYVTITVIKDPLSYPTDGDTQIKDAIVAYGDLQNTGKDIVASRIVAAAFKVTGVLDVTSCFMDLAPGPTVSTTIPISLRELAVYDATRIVVNSSDGVP